jgi:fructokinase
MARKNCFTANKRPLIFGEVLYDCFPDGSRVLGGAPFNVAWHLHGFGLSPLLLTRIGRDAAGSDVLKNMNAWGMDTRAIQHDTVHPTGTVTIKLHADHNDFHIAAAQAYDYIDRDTAAVLLNKCEIGLFYHGTLAARSGASRATLHWLRRELEIPTFIDINLRAPWWQKDDVIGLMQGTQWTKLNEDELHEFVPADMETAMAAQQFSAQHQLDNVVVTRGAHGALLLHDDHVYECPAPPVTRLVDTVGAGDAFSAVMLLGLTRGWDPQQTLRNAAEFAAAICTRRGATVSEYAFYEEFINHWEG